MVPRTPGQNRPPPLRHADAAARLRSAALRWVVAAIVLPLCAASLFAAYALAARFVLHGPVTAASLHEAVERESGSAGSLVGGADHCRRLRTARTWKCSVHDSAGSGGVDYRVRVRSGSSCFDGLLTTEYGEGGMPKRISGCVYRWQWTLLDLL